MMKRQKNSFLTPLDVRVLEGGKRFMLLHQFTYVWRYSEMEKFKALPLKIVVPIGFVTDFASIPRILRLIIPKLGRWNKAAVLHDHAYQTQSMTRKQVDSLFRDAMRDLGVVRWKIFLMFWSVRLFGWLAWRKDKSYLTINSKAQ